MAPIKWDPLARCPIFERTLAFLGYSPEVMRCVQRYLGSGLLGRIRGADLVVLPDTGHLSALERPEAFAAALLDFLAGLPAGGTGAG